MSTKPDTVQVVEPVVSAGPWPVPPELSGDAPGPLDEEIAYYLKHLPEWGEHEDEHVLIKGSTVYGYFGTRSTALTEGIRRFGNVEFLVKKVILDEKPRSIGWVIL